MSTVNCPYCRVSLTCAPKRRIACPSCGKPIIVRRSRLCTEDEARALDVCTRLGVTHDRLDATRRALSSQFGRLAGAGDAVWRILHEVLAEGRDWQRRRIVYFQMSRFLWEDGKDCLQASREATRMQLEDWKASADAGLLDLGRARLVVITSRQASCPTCRALDGATFTYQQAQESMPIP